MRAAYVTLLAALLAVAVLAATQVPASAQRAATAALGELATTTPEKFRGRSLHLAAASV